MPVETMKTGPEEQDDDASGKSPERVATGPLADIDPAEPQPAQTFDTQTLLRQIEQLSASRNPDEEVDTVSEREEMGKRLEKVSKLFEAEQRKNEALGAVRQDLGVPHENTETLQKLEEARETLEEEQRRLKLAEEYNDVLDSFSGLSAEEITHIAETGKTRKGEVIKSKYGKEIHSDVAKELANLYLGGKRRVTWGALTKLGKVADRILHDLVSAVKGVFKGPEGGRARKNSE